MKDMTKRQQRVREGAYITGLVAETVNRLAKLSGKRQLIKKGFIYNCYRIGRVLKR